MVRVSQLAQLARYHLSLVTALRDLEIEHLTSLPLHSTEAVYGRAVARSLLDDRDEALLRLRRAGILTLDVAADALPPSLINRYREIKAQASL